MPTPREFAHESRPASIISLVRIGGTGMNYSFGVSPKEEELGVGAPLDACQGDSFFELFLS